MAEINRSKYATRCCSRGLAEEDEVWMLDEPPHKLEHDILLLFKISFLKFGVRLFGPEKSEG